MPTSSAGDSRFWQFSLDFYSSSRVQRACLELQDRAGVDVNVLFFALFLATQRRKLSRTDIERIDGTIKSWREDAVVPLRVLRRKLKTGIAPFSAAETDAMRSAVKRIELEAEHLEQLWLERNLPADSLGEVIDSSNVAAESNIDAYGEYLNGFHYSPVADLLLEFAAYVSR